jgi:hypothetical protein
MKKITLIIAVVLISFVSVSAQNVKGKEIKDRDIEWSDFVGDVNESSPFDAFTNWVTTYTFARPEFKNNTARIKLTVHLFLRADSWVKPNKKAPRLLNHERGHYKIGQLCAKEIEETVNSMDFDRNDYARQINDVYWKVIEKYKEFERQYDRDTEHYRNQPQQESWDKKLNDLLKQ